MMKQYTMEFHAEIKVWAENEKNAITKGFSLVLQSGNAFLYPVACIEDPPIDPLRLQADALDDQVE